MKKKKVVTDNSNILIPDISKKEIVNMDPNCEYCLKQIPISPARVDRLIEELQTWVEKNPDAKAMYEFYYDKGFSRATYYRLMERYPKLKEMHEIASHKLGGRLWGKAVDKKAEWGPVKFMLHKYDPDYDEAKKYEAELSKKEDVVDKGPQFIVLEKFPDSPLVPKKKDT